MPAQLHYPRLYLLCDDWACFEIDVYIIRGLVYPKMPKVTVNQIGSWLKEYADNGLLFRWFVGDTEFGYWTGQKDSVRLLSPSRRHKRKTPEPNTQDIGLYQQNYKETTSVLQKNAPVPVPVLNPVPVPDPVPDPLFEKFWKEYPRKDAKQRALESWEDIGPDAALAAKITNAIVLAKKAGVWSERQYTPLPSTWLNQKRWTDEIEPNGKKETASDRAFALVQKMKDEEAQQ